MKRKTYAFMGLALALIVFFLAITIVQASPAQDKNKTAAAQKPAYRFTPEQRKAAAARFKKQLQSFAQTERVTRQALDPGGVPHYFGPYANYANSPMPKGQHRLHHPERRRQSGYIAPMVIIDDVVRYRRRGPRPSATVAGGVITGIDLTSPGSNYTAPIVMITDPTGVDG